MNTNLEIIYDLIKGQISEKDFNLILGDITSKALYLFNKRVGSDTEINFALLLVESLDTEILNDKGFLKIFILDILLENNILLLKDELNIKCDNPNIYKYREEILKLPLKNIIRSIIVIFCLEEEYFLKPKSKNSKNSFEIVEPLSPINDNNIFDVKSEYLCLHPYQKRVKDKSTKLLLDSNSNFRKFLIHMPTGSGKTKTCVESIIDYLRTEISSEGYVIWFAHSKELCEQSYETLKRMWKLRGDESLPFYKVFGDNDINLNILNHKRAVIFIGFQKFNSIISSKKTDVLSFRTRIASLSKLTIVDEAHKSLAPTYKNAIEYVTRDYPGCKLIGLTATPGRTNEASEENEFLSNFFNNNLIPITNSEGVELDDSIKYLQEKKFQVLANIEKIILEFDLEVNFTIDPSNSSSEELSDKDLKLVSNASVINPDRNLKILHSVQDCLKDPEKESILIFAASTMHCMILQTIFRKNGIESGVVLGSTNKFDRSRIIDDFKTKKLKVLINYSVLSTGFDAPKLNTLIIARTINSNILGSQIIGRALRGPKNGGNEKNTIIVLKDNITGVDNPSFLFSYWENFWGKSL
jgi:DNA repair protein RadD